MLLLGGGEIEEELADGGIAAALGGLPVEAIVLKLHHLGALPDRIDAHVLHEPGGLVIDEAGDVVAADQRDEIAEFLAIGFGQPAAVLVLLLRHVGKDQRRGREAVAQGIGEGGVGAGVVILARNRERQQLLLGQFGKGLHAHSSSVGS